jgi:hypothetical protein
MQRMQEYFQLLSLIYGEESFAKLRFKRAKNKFFGAADSEIRLRSSQNRDRANELSSNLRNGDGSRIVDGSCWSWARKSSASTFQNVQDKHLWVRVGCCIFVALHCVNKKDLTVIVMARSKSTVMESLLQTCVSHSLHL